MSFKIKCVKIIEGKQEEIVNNSNTNIGCTLKFSIISKGGLIEPFDKLRVHWEVSNGGQCEDYFHQEVYYKGKDENEGLLSFSRELSYIGTHLLRCQIINKKKDYNMTEIFVVNGI